MPYKVTPQFILDNSVLNYPSICFGFRVSPLDFGSGIMPHGFLLSTHHVVLNCELSVSIALGPSIYSSLAQLLS